MPLIHLEKQPDEPIVLHTFEGQVTSADVEAAYQRTAQLWSNEFETLGCHVVVDLTRMTGMTFADALHVLQTTIEQERLLQPIIPFVCWYFVGTSPIAKLYVSSRRLLQFGGKQVPLFAHLDDAITAARTGIASRIKETA